MTRCETLGDHTAEPIARPMRVDADGIERESAERAICDRCGVVGWRGDWPDQGGIVADSRGELVCDACADHTAEKENGRVAQ